MTTTAITGTIREFLEEAADESFTPADHIRDAQMLYFMFFTEMADGGLVLSLGAEARFPQYKDTNNWLAWRRDWVCWRYNLGPADAKRVEQHQFTWSRA